MEHKIILEGVVGSTAYGLATPESDIDTLGIYMYDLKNFVSLTPGPDTKVFNDPDKTLHELNKFISLLMKNNPTVMEFLWLDEYLQSTWEGQTLIDARRDFLSQQVRQTYGGYALQQKERLMRRGDFGSDLKKRTAKHGRHCFRLLIQGMHILQHQEIRVRLTDEEIIMCREAGELAANDPEKFAILFEEWDARFKTTDSKLPGKPDYDAANKLIWNLRRV